MDTLAAVETALGATAAVAALRATVRVRAGLSSGWLRIAIPAVVLAAVGVVASHESVTAIAAVLLVAAAWVLNADNRAVANPADEAAAATLRRLRSLAAPIEWCPDCNTWACVDLTKTLDEAGQTYLLAHSWRPSNTGGMHPALCSRVHRSLLQAA